MDVYADTFVPTALADCWFRSQPCPDCGHETLRPVATLGPPHWLCISCDACWMPVQGKLQRVEPWICVGCATRGRRVCIARAQIRR